MVVPSLLDHQPFSIGSIFLILGQAQAVTTDLSSWMEIANNLTTTGVLFVGLYILYHMNQKTEEKRDKNIKDLVEKIDSLNEEKNKILLEQLRDSEEERRTLQSKIINTKKDD